MGPGIYPTPEVSWGSPGQPPSAAPDTPLDSRGKGPSWDFPIPSPGLVPGEPPAQGWGGLEECPICLGGVLSVSGTSAEKIAHRLRISRFFISTP